MKLTVGVILISLIVACNTPKPDPSNFQMEELVLIEFAARLEEDYHKMHPIKGSPPEKVAQPVEYEDPSQVRGDMPEPVLMDEK